MNSLKTYTIKRKPATFVISYDLNSDYEDYRKEIDALIESKGGLNGKKVLNSVWTVKLTPGTMTRDLESFMVSNLIDLFEVEDIDDLEGIIGLFISRYHDNQRRSIHCKTIAHKWDDNNPAVDLKDL